MRAHQGRALCAHQTGEAPFFWSRRLERVVRATTQAVEISGSLWGPPPTPPSTPSAEVPLHLTSTPSTCTVLGAMPCPPRGGWGSRGQQPQAWGRKPGNTGPGYNPSRLHRNGWEESSRQRRPSPAKARYLLTLPSEAEKRRPCCGQGFQGVPVTPAFARASLTPGLPVLRGV